MLCMQILDQNGQSGSNPPTNLIKKRKRPSHQISSPKSISPPLYFASFNSASATSSFCPTLPLRPAGFSSLAVDSSTFFASAAFFNRSVSSALMSFVLASSSSLSPRLNGSCSSASGFGAIEVKGCHFLPPDLLPVTPVCWPLGEGLR